MTALLAKRLASMVLVLLGASAVLFGCLFVLPGDPIAATQGRDRQLDPVTRDALARRYRLDDPLPVQYAHYLGRLVRGDLGESYVYRRPVTQVLASKVGPTLVLAASGVAVMLLVGVSAGVLATLARRPYVDVLVTLATALALSVPTFVVGVALRNAFAVRLGWIPFSGGGLRSLILPALTVAAVDAAVVARLARSSLANALAAGHSWGELARGASGLRVAAHALRVAIVPVVAYVGVTFGALLGGAVVTESVFDRDGLGLVLVRAVGASDNPVVLGAVVYGVVGFVLVSTAVDIVQALLDPRDRLL